jgi:hypothetical protein
MKSVHDMTNEEYSEYRNKYIDFMYNPDNEHNCYKCPENINGNGCGLTTCCVTAHCERQYDDTE